MISHIQKSEQKKEKKSADQVKKQGKIMFLVCTVVMVFFIIFLMIKLEKDTNQIFNEIIRDMLLPSHMEKVENMNLILDQSNESIEVGQFFSKENKKQENCVYHFICSSEGAVLAGDVKYYSDTLQKELSRRRVSDRLLQELENKLKTLPADETYYFSNLEGNGIYLAASDLGYDDWILVSEYLSSDMKKYKKTIVRNSRLFGLIPLVCCILLAVIGLRYYLRQRRNLEKGQARYDILAGFSDTVLFEYDCIDKTLVFTPNITTLFHVKEIGVIRPFDSKQSFMIIYPEDIPKVLALLESVEDMQDGELRDITIRFMDKNGNYRWVRWQARLSRGRLGKPQTLCGKISDVQEEMQKEEMLVKRASVDALTGALNRASVEGEIRTQLGMDGKKGFLLMVDVDNFKSVNDTWGHSAGDRVLKRLVEEMRKIFRKDDLIGRLGGDEFIIFIPDMTNQDVLKEKADNLLKNIAGSEDIPFTISMGAAAYPESGKTYEELYLAADEAMYYAKNHGKSSLYVKELPI